MSQQPWFAVDRVGLRKLVEGRGVASGVLELIQNAWDQDVRRVDVSLTPVPGRPAAQLIVEDDDPAGFAQLDHSFTLFAESTKKANPEKRGRFNLGEKLVLALCSEATISTTSGMVRFDASGRHRSSGRRERGSRFEGVIRLTRDELAAVEEIVAALIVPPDIITTFNGRVLEARTPLKEFVATLPADIADDDGVLRRVKRACAVRVYSARSGEGMLYEMGIPVVVTGDTFDVDVAQKIPLNFNRDNVPPAYLRLLRTVVLNEMHESLSEADASAAWVREAASDSRCADSAITSVLAKRFGEKRVISDPSDTEGTKLAASKGFTVVHGGSLSAGEWANAKRAQAILPAGQVTPSPRVIAAAGAGAGADPYEISPTNYTDGMRRLAAYAGEIGSLLLGEDICVRLVDHYFWRPAHSREFVMATYGDHRLTFNVARVKIADRQSVNALLIHELAHHFSSDHLSEQYHDALCDLGAALVEILPKRPDLFSMFDTTATHAEEDGRGAEMTGICN